MAFDRVMTPSGRVSTILGNPPGRPPGPTQSLIPVGPPTSYEGVPLDQLPSVSPRAGTDPATAHQMLVGLPKLNSPFVDQFSGNTSIPWTQFLTNIWRLAQPTGIVPGTFAGITFNVFGQAISAVSSGFTLDSPVLTGNPTAPTPPANDNSTRIATTAFVKEQGYITGVTLGGDLTGSGANPVTSTLVGFQGRPVSGVAPAVGQAFIWNGSAWVPGQAGIPDAPSDGQLYARQNGQWARLSQAVIPPV